MDADDLALVRSFLHLRLIFPPREKRMSEQRCPSRDIHGRWSPRGRTHGQGETSTRLHARLCSVTDSGRRRLDLLSSIAFTWKKKDFHSTFTDAPTCTRSLLFVLLPSLSDPEKDRGEAWRRMIQAPSPFYRAFYRRQKKKKKKKRGRRRRFLVDGSMRLVRRLAKNDTLRSKKTVEEEQQEGILRERGKKERKEGGRKW